jgi:hypothetical protein
MSTPLKVLLKPDPCLEGDVGNDKADPSVCLHLGKRDQGEFDQHTLLHHQAVLHYTLPHPPLHLLLIIIILLLLLLILLLLLLLKEVWKACRPSLLSCRGQALASYSPRFQNMDSF